MSSGARLAMSDDGRLVVVKRAGAGVGTERLRQEAEILRRAAHPGVVELVDDHTAGADACISTTFVGGRTLSDLAANDDVGLVTRALATAASTLADLHDRGISHGRVRGDHVLMGEDGQAVLCGLAEATLPDREEDRAGSGGAGGEEQAGGGGGHADVSALATLVREVAGSRSGPDAQALQRLAERVLTPEAAARPSMRQLATSLRALDPGPAPVRPAAAAAAPAAAARLLPARHPSPGRVPRRGVVVAAVAMMTLVGLGLALIGTTTGGGGDQATITVPPAPATTAGPGATTVATTVPTILPRPPASPPVRVWPAPPGEAEPAPRVADVDGDGSPDLVEVEAGVITAGGARWQVAAAGEIVMVGDWDCDALPTPAVVRPGSGQVWVYPRWAGEGEEVAAELAGVAPRAVSATIVGPDATGDQPCAAIEVTDETGTQTVISPEH